jgi:CheY-like chemotaxis protein
MSEHILVVDDDPDIRAIIAHLLELEGFQVTTAANGRAALDQIAHQPPRLVLLDLQMPVLTGWEVLSQLRRAQPAVPAAEAVRVDLTTIWCTTNQPAGRSVPSRNEEGKPTLLAPSVPLIPGRGGSRRHRWYQIPRRS